ncbi:4'-phosphopantetheinyl transferase family protein [Novosphingobium olei]|uniref:4'-phosphopantetheinyl transferase superfamily protein n=1 Tax=Novosphingobium olei TaxID=2728851 RepID=A0A7Y0BSJ1_9SPHN|nr:4'-phosphopantetheinyl transferase superfamily protein [Novosphingobium olei]NML95756.1 4'-phosphopantetheinyl transferase superfamily protein [Novosphingobium olei]
MWFSLSHADGVSICAVTGAGPEIGIDLERIASGRNSLEIAEQFFSDAESTALRNLHPAQQTEAFVRLWALKESYVKAREIGLADGLSGTTFDLSPPDEIGVIFAHGLRERAQDWHFRLLRLGMDRILAIAVRQPSVATLLLRTQNWHGL